MDVIRLQQLEKFIGALECGPLGSRCRFALVAASVGDSKDLRGLGTYGFIKNAPGFIVGVTVDNGNAMEDFGYLMESIILYATDLGLGTCWLGGSFSRSRFAKKIAAKNGEVIPAVTSVGYIAEKPTRVDKMIRKEAHASVRYSWEQLFFDGAFDTPLNPQSTGAWAEPLEMVRLGPSASNRQPWRIIKSGDNWHFYLRRTPGYRDNTLSKLLRTEDLQRVDMGIAMSHFELTAREANLPGGWQVNDPGLERPNELTEYTVSWLVGSESG